jgi:hypothetical protein
LWTAETSFTDKSADITNKPVDITDKLIDTKLKKSAGLFGIKKSLKIEVF